MKTVTLHLPESVELSEFDINIILAELYQHGKLTMGEAAGWVGISKREFIETIGQYGISIFSESVEDLRRDIEHA
jgi:predicted HTH domain antitoxin